MNEIRSYIENHIQVLVDDLRARLLFMAAKTQQAFHASFKSIEDLNIELAQQVIDGDSEINDLELEIDTSSLSILARTQPVASDLRLLITALRMVTDLERIADESVNIASHVLIMQEQTATTPPDALLELLNKAEFLLDESIRSFSEKDANLALQICNYSDEVAALSVKAIEQCTKLIRSNTIDSWLVMHYILIARSVDRVASRAINIAEHTYFTVEGINIKHQ